MRWWNSIEKWKKKKFEKTWLNKNNIAYCADMLYMRAKCSVEFRLDMYCIFV